MKKNKLSIPKLFTTPSKSLNREEVYPFTQQAPSNQFPIKPTNKSEAPSDLFSRFTADIIRQEVVFTR